MAEDREQTTTVTAAADGARIVAVWPGGAVSLELPPSGTLTLGRDNGADICIPHSSVSRRHARITLGEPTVLEDLGSSNGTWVNGSRLASGEKRGLLADGCVELGAALLAIKRGSRTRGRTPESPSASARGVVVSDPAMEKLHEILEVIAGTSLSIVLLGETGVGKEVLASRIHSCSPRASKPFVRINCAALVETLLESELFGHERGAFTGAAKAKVGLLESASGGTLFLDEVGELPLTTQAKLLRVLETGEVMRIGAVRPHAVDVRFIAATNRDLAAEAASGRFRTDLLFRLDGATLHIPPLRQRTSEILVMAESFLAAASLTRGMPMTLSEDARSALLRHPWPGNVRELQNVVTRSAILCKGTLLNAAGLRFAGVQPGPSQPLPLPSPARADALTIVPSPRSAPDERSDALPALSTPAPPMQDLEEERARIREALEACAGNQTRAAKMLGIARRTLVKRLTSLGLPRPRK